MKASSGLTSSGYYAIGGIGLVVLCSLSGLASYLDRMNIISLFTDPEIRYIIVFSLMQASLSTLFSILLAIPIALSLARRREMRLCRWLIHFSLLIFVTPSIVAILGLVGIYGNQGLLITILKSLSIPIEFSIYGLTGILLAHLFFNIPFAIRIFFNSLLSIPNESRRLCCQFGMSSWQQFFILEWPTISKGIADVAILIFVLCFTSFAIVLTFGGGPAATTLEVAIYQAIRFEFDLPRGVALSLVQITLCLLFIFYMCVRKKDHIFGFDLRIAADQNWCLDSIGLKVFDAICILFLILFLLPPLLYLGILAYGYSAWVIVLSDDFLQALQTSVFVGLLSASLSMTLAITMAITAVNNRLRNKRFHALAIESTSLIIMIIPPITFATGLFLMIRNYLDIANVRFYILVLLNALLTLPFCMRMILAEFHKHSAQYSHLALSLGIQGLHYFRLILLPLSLPVMALAFSLAMLLSFGDLGVITLFGTQELQTLPLLIYRLLGVYRLDAAAVVAIISAMVCLLSFYLFAKTSKIYDA